MVCGEGFARGGAWPRSRIDLTWSAVQMLGHRPGLCLSSLLLSSTAAFKKKLRACCSSISPCSFTLVQCLATCGLSTLHQRCWPLRLSPPHSGDRGEATMGTMVTGVESLRQSIIQEEDMETKAARNSRRIRSPRWATTPSSHAGGPKATLWPQQAG